MIVGLTLGLIPQEPARPMKPPHVVFVVHEASRSGAPILLLHLASWLKQNSDWTFEVVLQAGGPLVDRFRELGPVTLYLSDWEWRSLHHPARWRRGLAQAIRGFAGFRLRARLRRQRPTLLYYNTMAVSEVFDRLAPLGIPTIVHVHELESVIRFFGADRMAAIERSRPQYIAASRAVADNLATNHAIPRDRLEVIHEFIKLPEVPATDPVVDRAALCDRLGISRDSVLVGGTGTIEQRKGVDLFVAAARHLRDLHPTRPVHFLWMGRALHAEFEAEIHAQIERDGLQAMVHLLGQVAEPFGTMRLFDVFALTSREDPYPLAMLEAGALGVPVVGFAASGGAPEYIEDDAGVIVPFEDAAAMARAILGLADDPARARALGATGAAKVRDRHTLDRTAPRVDELIRRVAGAGGLRTSGPP